jgi:L-arabinose isomerase
MIPRPKIGALFLAGDSWWEAGVCQAADGPYAGFIQKVESDVAAISAWLARDFEVVTSGLLHTTAEAIAEAERFNAARVDAIVFCPIIWTNDAPVVAFLQHAQHAPLLMWAYDPYGGFPEYYRIEEWLRASGPVSVQQSSNLLRRLGWRYEVVFGNEKDKTVQSTVRAFVRAAAVRRSLQGMRIAVLPAPCQMVIGSWMDQFYLLEKFGVELEYVPVERYANLVATIPEIEAREYAAWLQAHCEVVDTPEEILLKSCRHALAMVRMAESGGYSGIAIEDFNQEFYRLLGCRPHLYHPQLGEMGCTVGLEADVPGVLATILVGRLAGRMGMFNEFFSIDPSQNLVLMGHPGMGELSLGDPDTFTVTPDLEFDASQERGAWVSYRAKAGEMTFLNMTPEYGRLKVTAFTGEALPGPRLMEGYAHMLVQPRGNVCELFRGIVRRGLIQHWGTVHGNIVRELTNFCEMTELELEVIQ